MKVPVLKPLLVSDTSCLMIFKQKLFNIKMTLMCDRQCYSREVIVFYTYKILQ